MPRDLARALRRAALASAFVSGFAMLACELLWARVLTFVFGHDTYAFASLLTFVLLGLGAGGLAHRAVARVDQRKLLAALLAAFAGAVLACFWLSAWLVIRYGRDPFALEASGRLATSLRLELYRELAYTPMLVLLPSLLAGAIYPTACSLYAGDAPDVARRTGAIGLSNGVGSALGAVCAALVLVSAVGIQGGFLVMALLTVAASSLVMLAGTARPPRAAIVALAPLAAVVALALLLPDALPRRMLLATVGPRHQTLLHYQEARIATVSVIQNQIHGEKQLLVNGVNEVTTRLVHDQSFKILGHLAPLLHARPRRGLMICLGAGLSAGAALRHPLERLDIVDLSAAVAGGARWFSAENNGVLDDPRLRLHIDDGRQFLLKGGEPYDVAMIDSTHPKSVDSWILYTEEFYRLLRARLAPGGIAVQWLPLHGMSEREFKIVVRTFRSVFPEMTLWANVGFETYGHVGYAKLVGAADGPLAVDIDRLAAALGDPRIHDDLVPFGMAELEEVLALFLAGPASIDAWTAGLPVQTDDRPILPYTTVFSGGRRMEPRLLLGARSGAEPWHPGASSMAPERQRRSAEARETEGLLIAGLLHRAAEHRPSAKVRLYLEQAASTLPYYQSVAARYADDADMLFEVGTQLAALGHPAEARDALEAALRARPNDFRTQLNLALCLADVGERERAVETLVRLRARRPDSPVVHHNLGALALAAGDPGTAAAHFREALARGGTSPGLRVSLARAYLDQRLLDRAARELDALVADDPWVAEAHELLGVCAAARGDHAAAAAHLGRAVAIDPYRVSAQHQLGLALHRTGLVARAADAYRAALSIEPRSAAVLDALGVLRRDEGDFDGAAELHLSALDVDPRRAEAAFNLGVALRGQGRNAEAIGAFCLALTLEPSLGRARVELVALGQEPQRCGM